MRTLGRLRVLGVLGVLALLSGCGGTRRDAGHDPAHGGRVAVGDASWYGDPFTGRPTASGEIFDPRAMTAAHRTLPLGAVVRVTNLQNGRSALVRINDRGPYVAGRILDCSEGTARALGFRRRGVTRVAIDWPEDPLVTSKERRGTYWLQLGAFTSERNARLLRVRASAHADSVVLRRGGEYVRVHAGPFTRRKHAEKALARLQEAGLLGVVVCLDP